MAMTDEELERLTELEVVVSDSCDVMIRRGWEITEVAFVERSPIPRCCPIAATLLAQNEHATVSVDRIAEALGLPEHLVWLFAYAHDGHEADSLDIPDDEAREVHAMGLRFRERYVTTEHLK